MARGVARALDFIYVDSGALYRGVTWLALEAGLDGSDEAAVMQVVDAAELRVKESDRISEMVKHLRSFGVSVDEFEDGMRVQGGAVLKTPAVPLRCDGDHRIAMSMAILNTFADGALILDEVECVDTSYPSFWSDMVSLGGRVDR